MASDNITDIKKYRINQKGFINIYMANTWEIKILYKKNWTCCYSFVIGYFCRIIFKKSKQKWVSQLIGMCTKRHLEIPRNRKLDTTAQEFDLSMQKGSIWFYIEWHLEGFCFYPRRLLHLRPHACAQLR